VARSSHCRVDHGPPSSIVQIGLVIVPPATPGTIDNYLLGYATDSAELAAVLEANGVDVHRVARIDYDAGDTTLDVSVPARHPVVEIAGTIARSSTPNGSFVANWWRASGGALVELTTTYEPLVALVGNTLGFPILQQYNSFASADMVVTTH
jgi:hypothetical protein